MTCKFFSSFIKIGKKLDKDLKRKDKESFKCHLKKIMKKFGLHNADKFGDIYDFITCMPYSKDNVKVLQDMIFTKIFTPKKKILKRSEPLKSISISFLNNIKADPDFISLDQEFISFPSDETYNNLLNYFTMKFNELTSTLNLPFGYAQNLFAMDDQFLPLFKIPIIPLFGDVENTFANYKAGKIQFPDSNCYSTITQSLVSNSEKDFFLRNLKLIVADKLGVGGSLRYEVYYPNPETKEAVADSSGSLIDSFSAFFKNPYVAAVIAFIIIVVIIIVVLCETGTVNCST
jgi:hypothetical protein